MFLLLLIVGALATEAPTVPTPYPTITPAPKSDCSKIQDDDKGPFPLDCLQSEFIRIGCSIRGHSYPTESSFSDDDDEATTPGTHNKEIYNDLDWKGVQALFQSYNDNQGDTGLLDESSQPVLIGNGDTRNQCLGPDTNSPTPEPTAPPTSLVPTPAPVVRDLGDSQTPAPVFAEDTPFKELIPGDNEIAGSEADTGTKLKDACIARGYQREYDDSEYVIQIITTTDGSEKIDYYTTATDSDVVTDGNTGGICELLGDPTGKTFYWSDRHDGPFQLITIDGTSGAWSIAHVASTKTGDQRVFPRWIAPDSGTGGYYTTAVGTEASAQAFEVKIATKRSFQPCRERIPPQATSIEGLSQSTFSTRCQRKGRDGQNFNHDSNDKAVECSHDDKDKHLWELHYAIANNRYASCDSNCIWALDYVGDGESEAEKQTLYWEWQSNSIGDIVQCWKRRTDVAAGTFNQCDISPSSAQNFLLELDYLHAEAEKEKLCKPRCDYAHGWILGPEGDNNCYQMVVASDYTISEANRFKADDIVYDHTDASNDTNPKKGVALCNARLRTTEEGSNFRDGANAFGVATLASVNSREESQTLKRLCSSSGGGCYFCGLNVADLGKEEAACEDGEQLTFTHWVESESAAWNNGDNGNNMVLNDSGEWEFKGDDETISVLCKAPANFQTGAAQSREDTATQCMDDLSDLDYNNKDPAQDHDSSSTEDGVGRDNADNEKSSTKSHPVLDVGESGFTDSANPGTLHLQVNIPRTMFNVYISFENSTNDKGDYNWQWEDADGAYWSIADGNSCSENDVYSADIPWTVFNLGGAGGVVRLDTYEDSDGDTPNSDTWEPNENYSENDLYGHDMQEQYYQFGSVIRLEATQPIRSSEATKDNDATHTERVKRTMLFKRQVTVRMPFILRFQKTITVDTDVNIVSTKFNYKTVAAIIQSVQHSTQYFKPPYAKVDVQIRTKSQYPYRFQHNGISGSTQDSGDTKVTLHRGDVADTNDQGVEENEMVDLSLDWLVDDANCTFTNPDHMREGDICVQEWMLHIVPKQTQCYATGEYTLEFKATCFHEKDVCYLPKAVNGDYIDTVKFTFKIQTSKFCPVVADTVDLTGTLTVKGRNSFKPLEECDSPGVGCVQDDTNGSFYMQGETIHLLAKTASTKATIAATSVVMVELEQELSGLVQTGYNRVPYDANLNDVTIWTCDDLVDGTCNDAARVNTGLVTIDDGPTTTEVTLIQDADVFSSGTAFAGQDGSNRVAAGKTGYSFTSEEAGFRILLHARAFPVNVDSYGSKKLIVTLAVEYTDLDRSYESTAGVDDGNQPGRRRRRLLAASTNVRQNVNFGVRSFKPKSLPNGLGKSASFAISLTMDSKINRANVHLFSHSLKGAIVTALNENDSYTVYPAQVSIDAIKSNGVEIWRKTTNAGMKKDTRRLEDISNVQRIEADISFGKVDLPNSMPLKQMVTVFDKQIRSPSSPLMHQPVFYGAIVHEVKTLDEAPVFVPEVNNNDQALTMDSSAFALLPCALFALLSALL